MNPSGIGLPNNAHPREWGKMLQIPWSCFTLLHQQRDRVPELRDKFPAATILVRAYTPNWFDEDPIAWAQSIAQWANELKPYNIAVTFANEQNLKGEGHPLGWPVGENGNPPAQVYHDILKWGLQVVQTLRPLIPGIPIHFPALSQGRSDDQNDSGYIGFEILRPLVDACDVLDVHTYWNQANADWNSKQFGRRYELVHALFPTKPLFISEYGGFPMDHPTSAEQYKNWLDQISGVDYIQGATAFIWDSDDVNAAWTIQNKPALVSMFQNYQPPATPPPAVVLPLEKARWFVEETLRQLEAKNADAAHKILTEIVMDWFDHTTRENSTDLQNAQAHATARGWCQEAIRKIEQNNLTEAHDILRDRVWTWLNSKGPGKIGILSAETPSKPKAKPKVSAKKSTKKKATAKTGTAKKSTAKKTTARSAKTKARGGRNPKTRP